MYNVMQKPALGKEALWPSGILNAPVKIEATQAAAAHNHPGLSVTDRQ